MDKLPPTVTEYRRTRVFTDQDVPAALTRDHDTKPGVWGRLEVQQGAVVYRVLEGEHAGEYRVEAGASAVITPATRHRVELIGPVMFQVVFLR